MLDLGDRECLALRAVIVAATVADEVVVDGAVPAATVLLDQATTTFDAVDRALEVVVMGARAFTVAPRGEYVLDGGPGRMADERFVGSSMLGSVESDDPDVVRVTEQIVHGT